MTTRSTPALNRTYGSPKSGSVEASTLDRRRNKMQATQNAARTSAAVVEKLDDRLHTNAGQRRALETELAAAMDTVAALKKAIKASARTRDKVRAARKDARRAAAKATRHAQRAEARYDHAVLADLLRREKDIDLTNHSGIHPEHHSGTVASDRLVHALAPHPTAAPQSSTMTRPRPKTSKAR